MPKIILKCSMVLIMVLSLVACGSNKTQTDIQDPTPINTVEQNDNVVEEPKTIIDSKGREITIPDKVEKVVALNSDVYDMLVLLGYEDKIIGVTDSMLSINENIQKLTSVGKWNAPNAELILELKPDVVLGYSKYMPEETLNILEGAGITVANFDFYNVKEVVREAKELGKFLKREELY